MNLSYFFVQCIVIFVQMTYAVVIRRRETERIAKDTSVKGYTNLDELFADLKT